MKTTARGGGARGSPSPWRREKSRLASPPLTRSAPCNKHILCSLHFGATKTQNRKNSQNKQCAAIRNSGVAGGVLCSNNRLSHFPGAIRSNKYVFVYKELNFTTNLFRIPQDKMHRVQKQLVTGLFYSGGTCTPFSYCREVFAYGSSNPMRGTCTAQKLSFYIHFNIIH